MDLDALKKRLVADEGWRNRVYLDTEGHPTIGVGFNLDREDARAKLRQVHADYDAVVAGTQELTNAQVSDLLDADILVVVDQCSRLFDRWDELHDGARIALASMCFNLGLAGLIRFHGMRAAVNDRDFSRAADEMLDSLWARQVGARAQRLAGLMRSASEA